MVKVNDYDPKVSPLEAPYLKVFTAATGNGLKVTILLELLKLDYTLRIIDWNGAKEQKEEWFLKINPNGKIPTIVEADAEGKTFALAESGALLLWIANKYDIDHKFSYDPSTPEHWEEVELLFFHVSGLTPAQGNLGWFKANAPNDKVNIDRFTEETIRSYKLLDDKLASNKSGYLVGDHISLADLISFSYAKNLPSTGIDANQFTHVQKWIEKIGAIPEVQKALSLK
ncbi:hypothetical protein BN7_5429 [Wickerhamomyces ciferrii]|uniref:Glutathione transferase n=1 Tax=Wickerhamomyces ciferrii (strain ATCC 14091 / BCRC 22168 / CBS 111 / JCM 3599 / NBRC 0793 / NRRL Y-1031 F-60-10) TaxID=1206466 RepID=K0KXQ6_WICCF|nr:uncharacterized protein BN7_5429 [Wickerhamomyces ciferrii]CCH45843.1 hypothetical protein BN7_5429 [Wickerhamomyces ciferrii]